jgi:energy-coupling factor transporter ATP-binding protein EcfA2
MTSLFISHSRSDGDATEQVAAILRSQGFSSLFLDVDPDQGILPGRAWEQELYSALRRSDGLVFLGSDASAASCWCSVEVGMARLMGIPIIPLRISPSGRSPLLTNVQDIDFHEQGWESRLHTGLLRAGLDPQDSLPWNGARSPYPGLAAFTSSDAAVFFGRDDEIEEVLQRLQPTATRRANRFIVVIGPSGSGKSSLVRAGVLPRLARLRNRWSILPPIVPGSDPVRNLAVSVARGLSEVGQNRFPNEIENRLSQDPGALGEYAQLIADFSHDPQSDSTRTNVLMVVDQAEELTTRSSASEQQRFLNLLRSATRADGPLWVLATLRSEFISTSPERSGLIEGSTTVAIEPLGRARLPEIILRPARRAGIDFTPGLVERMVEDTTGGDALPLLAYTLAELHHRIGSVSTIADNDYEAIGGVVGALQNRADMLVSELCREGHTQVIPAMMKLVAVDETGQPVRRRILQRTLSKEELQIIDAFVEARLATSDKSEHLTGGVTVEVAHEALLRQWPPLRDAIERSADSLRMRSELDRLAADWLKANKDSSYLLGGSRLTLFGQWKLHPEGMPVDLDDNTEEFLQASLQKGSLDRRSTRRRRLYLNVLYASIVLLLAGAVALLQQRGDALHERDLALNEALAARNEVLDNTEKFLAGVCDQLQPPLSDKCRAQKEKVNSQKTAPLPGGISFDR